MLKRILTLLLLNLVASCVTAYFSIGYFNKKLDTQFSSKGVPVITKIIST